MKFKAPLYPFFLGIERKLEGLPNAVLTTAMVIAGIALIYGAFKLPASAKPLALAYVLLP